MGEPTISILVGVIVSPDAVLEPRDGFEKRRNRKEKRLN